jgi:uncharacterized membrane protein YgcG
MNAVKFFMYTFMKVFISLILTLLCATAEERILSFDSQIHVQRDGFLDVVETIRVNVEGHDIKRGIYRDFPQDYKTKWGLKQHRPFEVTGVKRNGKPEPYEVNRMGSGTQVLIGSEDVLLEVGSEQEYQISYRTGRQLWFDEKGDELYWNVTGNFWNFPIVKATARVVLPEGIKAQNAEAYTGPIDATERSYEKTEEADGVSFLTTSTLDANEGLTIVVRWDPGKLDASAYVEPSIIHDNEIFFLGVMVVVIGFAVFLVHWFLAGRDPARGVIVPGWEPPTGFSPAAVRYLNNMSFDDTCFTAAVISLASKGFLKIEEYNSGSYKLIKQEGKGTLDTAENELFESLFHKGDELELIQGNHGRIGGVKAKLNEALRDGIREVYFHNHTGRWLIGLIVCFCGLALTSLSTDVPGVTIAFMIFAGLILIAMGFRSAELIAGRSSKFKFLVEIIFLLLISAIPLLVVWLMGGVWCVILMFVVMLVSLTFYFLMKAPTPAGRKVLDVIAGFREYLTVAEEDRLNLENPPQRTPELFERFIPYALALGVEQKWSEKFDDILAAASKTEQKTNYTPTYYTGSNSGLGNALSVVAIGSAIGGALASSSVAPSSSGSSGGRGGGRGGSSGGGGGGGGGGGW